MAPPDGFTVVDGDASFCDQIEDASAYLMETAGNPPKIPELIPGWIPEAETTLLAGAGGGGKSILALMLQASMAAGKPWIGLDVPRGRSLGFYSEDGRAVVANRLHAIAGHMGTTVPALLNAGMRVLPKPKGDVALVRTGRDGIMTTTPAFDDLCRAVAAFKPTLLNLDNVADFLPVVPFDNGGIRTARRLTLDVLCERYGVTIIGLQNVSLTGLRAEDEAKGGSGGLAWRDAFRARLHLRSEKDEDGGEDGRVLERVKANYAGAGDAIQLHWADGVWATDEPDALDRMSDASNVRWLKDEIVAVCREGVSYSTGSSQPTYLPKVIARRPGRPKRYGAKAIAVDYLTMLANGVIRLAGVHDTRSGRTVERVVAVNGVQLEGAKQ